VLLFLCVTCTASHPRKSKDVRATFISVNKFNTGPNEAQKTMQDLKSIGINRVYLSVWNQGLAYFNSSTLRTLVGPEALAKDQLSWGVKFAHLAGLEAFAWLEDGFSSGSSATTNPFSSKAQSLGWNLGNGNGFSWVDPRQQPVEQFFFRHVG